MEIQSLKWGEIVVSGQLFKDIKLYPGTVTTWDWNETGTRHNPGIQIADFTEFIDKVDYLVLSRGMDKKLGVSQQVYDFLATKDVVLIVADTIKATEMYNRLIRGGCKVGGLFHSTC